MPCLFADAMVDLGWLPTVIGGGLAGMGVLVAWLNGSRINIEHANRLNKRIDELTTQMFRVQDDNSKLRDDVSRCHDEHHQALVRENDLKNDLGRALHRIEELELKYGGPPALVPVPGVIIANFQGVIQEFSPSLTVTLGWTPEEMRGRNIMDLMPPDVVEAHRAKFAAAIKPGAVVDQTKQVLTYALDRDGRRVPVVIKLRRWDDNGGLMTATVTQRQSGFIVVKNRRLEDKVVSTEEAAKGGR